MRKYKKKPYMDVHTKEQRSYNMSQVKSENTLPERLIFKALKKEGIKFIKHNKKLPGKPDITISDQKIAVFINGEFWHGKNFKTLGKTLTPFWLNKIGKNLKRDRVNYRKLSSLGWKVLRFWGRDILKDPERALKKILKAID